MLYQSYTSSLILGKMTYQIKQPITNVLCSSTVKVLKHVMPVSQGLRENSWQSSLVSSDGALLPICCLLGHINKAKQLTLYSRHTNLFSNDVWVAFKKMSRAHEGL